MTDYLKAEQLTKSKWRVLAIPFGGEFKDGKDSDGEFFSQRTDIHGPYAGLIKERPTVFHHGKDSLLQSSVVGIEDDPELEKDGWWANVWLERSHRYHAQIDALLRAGKMYGSSGAVSHFVKTDRRTGEILIWPHIEQTLTLTPANRLSRVVSSKALDDFDDAGIALDEAVKALFTDLDSPTAALRPDLASAGEDAARLRARGIAIANSAKALSKTY